MRRKDIDPELVRQMAMIGCTIAAIAEHFHCCRDVIERHFRREIDEGKSQAEIRLKGKVFKEAMEGNMRALELCLINHCGWTIRPDVAVVTNVIQNPAPRRTPEQVKAHLVELQRAVWEECDRIEKQNRQLPPVAGS
jgi:hypothetical protein